MRKCGTPNLHTWLLTQLFEFVLLVVSSISFSILCTGVFKYLSYIVLSLVTSDEKKVAFQADSKLV